MFVLDDAAIAAAMAAAEAGAASAGTAAAGTAAAAAPAAGAMAAETVPLMAEGATMAAPAVEGAAPALSPEVANMGLNQAMSMGGGEPGGNMGGQAVPGLMQGDTSGLIQEPMQDLQGLMPDWQQSFENIEKGDLGDELANAGGGVSLPGMPEQPNPIEMFGLGSSKGAPDPLPDMTEAAPVQTAPFTPTADRHLSDIPPAGNENWGAMAENLDKQMAEGPAKEPTDWRGRLRTAQQALKMAQLLTTNKKDKQTLSLMEMGAGMGAADSPESTMAAMQGPLKTIAEGTQQGNRRLSEVPTENASQQQPMVPQSKGAAGLPATSLGGAMGMGMADRLRMIRGY